MLEKYKETNNYELNNKVDEGADEFFNTRYYLGNKLKQRGLGLVNSFK